MPQTPKKRKKIVYVITKSSWGGAGRYVYDLATNLPKDEFDVLVVAGGRGELREKLISNGIEYREVEWLRRDISISEEFRTIGRLTELFRELKPDVVHLNSSKIGGLGAYAGRRAKVPKIIFTAHGFAFNEERGLVWRIITGFATWVTMLLAHKTITISYKEEAQALKFPFIGNEKIEMIYIGTKERNFLPKDEARRYIQGINKKTPRAGALWLGSIGELHKNKGFDIALKMCKLLKEHGVNFFYFLIGEGEERKSLEAYIEEHELYDHVVLLGAIPSKTTGSTLMNAFDVFLMPSRKEGLPYVLLEAGLAKSAVVATNVGGIPEIITHKENGLLARDNKPEVYAYFIEHILRDERIQKEYGEKLYNHIAAKFMFTGMVNQTKALY